MFVYIMYVEYIYIYVYMHTYIATIRLYVCDILRKWMWEPLLFC